MRFYFRVTAIILAAAAAACSGNAWADPQVWFHVSNYQAQRGVDGPQGWEKLFDDPHAPWPESMRHVDVFAAAGILQTPDRVLAKAFQRLKQERVPFAIESLAQSWVHQPQCGQGVESYFDPPGARKIAKKIQAAGGEIVYVAMDEPLFYGHYYDGKNACQSSIGNVAERAAAIVSEYREAFPNVVIGDIEPLPALTNHSSWREDYKQWLKAFAEATGRPIAFVQVDVDWSRPEWPVALKQFLAFLAEERLPVGIIYNGNANAATNAEWLDSAAEHFVQVERALGAAPAQAIFHSWDRFPPQSISDQSALGEDYLLLKYARWRARGKTPGPK